MNDGTTNYFFTDITEWSFLDERIALAAVFTLIYTKKIQEPYVILVAAVVGLLIKYWP